jgi:hypothetical protein
MLEGRVPDLARSGYAAVSVAAEHLSAETPAGSKQESPEGSRLRAAGRTPSRR